MVIFREQDWNCSEEELRGIITLKIMLIIVF